MHVLLVSTSYPDSLSGSEAAGGFAADFAHELSRHVNVTVVAATSNESSVRTEGDVQVHRFGVKRWPLSLLKPHRPSDWWPIYTTLRDGLRTVSDVAAANRPDYTLALWALPSGHWARSMLRRHGIPYGVWALGTDIWGLGRVPVLRSYLGHVLAGAERRYADGLQLADEVERLSGRTCEFLPSTRRLSLQAPANPADAPPYKLAFLGRWHPNKGVDLFLHALDRLDDDDWSRISEVRIHGGGPLEGEVMRLVDELRALGRPISAGGYLEADAAAEFIAWCDYLVIPSRIESIPVVFSDAAQIRRPLVASPVGDLPDLIRQNHCGVLATDATAGALAAALSEALRTSANSFRPGLEAVAAQFNLTVIAEDFVKRLRETLT